MRASSWTGWTAPAVDRIDGVPPAIAIDQTNPVRTSRSTVGTMTEIKRPPEAAVLRAPDSCTVAAAQAGARDSPQ